MVTSEKEWEYNMKIRGNRGVKGRRKRKREIELNETHDERWQARSKEKTKGD